MSLLYRLRTSSLCWTNDEKNTSTQEGTLVMLIFTWDSHLLWLVKSPPQHSPLQTVSLCSGNCDGKTALLASSHHYLRMNRRGHIQFMHEGKGMSLRLPCSYSSVLSTGARSYLSSRFFNYECMSISLFLKINQFKNLKRHH